jgi:flagellar motility protein MotE (MotC chaperone)
MALCRATKASGDPCKAPATGLHGYCWAHDPANREQRSRMASRAARSKPSREIAELKKQLKDLATGVLEGEVERGTAAVVNQIINTRARLLELERRIKETEELEGRIEALEQSQEGGRQWGA